MTELELYGLCPVCRQNWSSCTRLGSCQLMGVMAGYNAALRGSLNKLFLWPTPSLVFFR